MTMVDAAEHAARVILKCHEHKLITKEEAILATNNVSMMPIAYCQHALGVKQTPILLTRADQIILEIWMTIVSKTSSEVDKLEYLSTIRKIAPELSPT